MTYVDGMGGAKAQHADQDLKNTWAEVIARFLNGNSRHANRIQADPHPATFFIKSSENDSRITTNNGESDRISIRLLRAGDGLLLGLSNRWHSKLIPAPHRRTD
jgi:hypothetical protein